MTEGVFQAYLPLPAASCKLIFQIFKSGPPVSKGREGICIS